MHLPRAATAVAAASAPRFAMYFDEWHTALPPKADTAGITHAITAFAGTTLFTTSPPGGYTPFIDVATLRTYFDPGTKICMAIGGWGDTAGYSIGQQTAATRQLYAQNIATTLDQLGYDCVGTSFVLPHDAFALLNLIGPRLTRKP